MPRFLYLPNPPAAPASRPCLHRFPSTRLFPRKIADQNVFESIIPSAPGMKLQRDGPILAFRFRVRVVHHRHAVQSRNVVIPLSFQQVFIPLAVAHHGLILRRRPDNPSALLLVNSAGVVAESAIDLKLRTLRHGRGSGLEPDVEEHSAVASLALAFEPQR